METALPLEGRRIVITRAEERGLALKEELTAAGATVISVPCIRFVPAPDRGPLERALERLESYDWVILTSSTAVEVLFDVARERGVPTAAWRRLRFGVVGPQTASQLASMGVRIEQAVMAATASALARTLLGDGSQPRLIRPGARCVIPQSNLARDDLQQALDAAGVAQDSVVAYETQAEPREKAEPFLAALRDGDPIDAIALASPSAFVNFLSMTAPEGELAIRRRAIWLFSIGPTTSRVIRERQLAVTREASPHTSRGLIDTILRFFAPPREAAEETTGGTEAPPSEAADEGPPT